MKILRIYQTIQIYEKDEDKLKTESNVNNLLKIENSNSTFKRKRFHARHKRKNNFQQRNFRSRKQTKQRKFETSQNKRRNNKRIQKRAKEKPVRTKLRLP